MKFMKILARIVLVTCLNSSEGYFNSRWNKNDTPTGISEDIINEGGYRQGWGGPRGDGSGLLGNAGGNARGHIGDTGMGTVMVTQDVLHKGDGKVYTSDEFMRSFMRSGSTKSLEQQIDEMRESALLDEKKSVEAGKKAAAYEAEARALDAKVKKQKAEMLQKAQENINKVLTSHKEELAKDIIPTVAVTPHSIGFVTHDRVALMRLNQVRKAAFQEGMSQKNNALLHENSNPLNPIEDVKSDPDLIKKLYENAPVNKKSAIVDPSKGKFSIMNDKMRKNLNPSDPLGKGRFGGRSGGYDSSSRLDAAAAEARSYASASGQAYGGYEGFGQDTDMRAEELPMAPSAAGESVHPGMHGFLGRSY